jgi:NAD(P)-dependent dehydrogenase (short-subunit alcohol dehydrogenase family)
MAPLPDAPQPAYASYPSLRDRIVLITGGGSGIGATAVEHFALQGAQVAFLDLAIERSLQLVEDLAPRCAHRPLFAACDLTDITALQQAIADITAQLGPPRVLLNNAGNDDRHLFEDVTPAYWDERMAVNLRHQFFAAQAVVPAMKAAGGSILNMSSIAWMIPVPDLTLYNMAKAAIVAMTRSLAREFGPYDVRVHCILPGAILTERQQQLRMTPEYEKTVLDSQCLKRHLLPAEVARLLLFLAADDSSAITGQTHIIDGGWI